MLEKVENSKSKHPEQMPLMPFWPTNFNVPLRGHIKQIGKYSFSFDQKLGSGLTSDAYIGINRQTNKTVCVKIIDRETFKNEKQKSLLDNQIKCQQNLHSEFIVNIFDVYHTNSFCFVVTQLCQQGDLFKLIQFSRFGLPERLVVRFGYHISQALLKMKQNKIIHRDIKSQNILLKEGVAKLGDFGFAIEEKNLQQKQQFNIGSPLYMPIQTLEYNNYSYQSDLFAFGVVLYEMLHGQSPWECFDEMQLINKMKNDPIVYKNGVSQEIKEVINSCLCIEKSKRGLIETISQKLSTQLKHFQSLEQDKNYNQAQYLEQKLKNQTINQMQIV